MEQVARLLKDTPILSGVDQWSLQYIAGLAERKEYKPNEWLFQEFAPREWFGIIEKGEVRIVQGFDDQRTCLAVLKEGGILSEHLLLNDLPHSVGCFTQEGAIVVQFSRQVLERAKLKRPDLYYQIVARVAHIVSDRMRYAAKRLAIESISCLESDIERKRDRNTWSILGGN